MTELDFALELADVGQFALDRFRSGAFTVERKEDGSPVTDVDREVERRLCERILTRYPDHAVVGEEFGGEPDAEWCWYLDPIDGTAKFVSEDPAWMVLVALAHHDELVLGVVDLPALGHRWWAQRGGGAFCDGKPVHVSKRAPLSAAVVTDDWRGTLASGRTDRPLARVAALAGSIREHEGHGFLAVAAGRADIAVNVGGYPWDFAPMQVIVEEAGGRYSDFDGQHVIDTHTAVVTNGPIHEEVLSVLGHSD